MSHSHGNSDKWVTLMGLLEPELKKIAEWLRRVTPRIHSEELRRLLGMFNAFLDSKTDNLSPITGTLLKQVTKIIDDVFLDDPAGHEASGHNTENTRIVGDWMRNVFNEARDRIKNSDNPAKEADQIKSEFAAIVEVLKSIEDEVQRQENNKKPVDTHHPQQEEHPPLTARFMLRYNATFLASISMIILSGFTVVLGVVKESNWVIFLGGLTLLATIILLGIILVPIVLGIDTIQKILRSRE